MVRTRIEVAASVRVRWCLHSSAVIAQHSPFVLAQISQGITIMKKPRKPGRPKTTGKGVQVVVRCHGELLDLLDAWRAQQPIAPSRPAAMRHAAEAWLRAQMRGR